MTNKVDFQTYLYLNQNQFIIYVAEILTNEKIYCEKLEIEENFMIIKQNIIQKQKRNILYRWIYQKKNMNK